MLFVLGYFLVSTLTAKVYLDELTLIPFRLEKNFKIAESSY